MITLSQQIKTEVRKMKKQVSKLSLCNFEGHNIYRLITDNKIFIGLVVDNNPVVFPDVEEAKKFIKTIK